MEIEGEEVEMDGYPSVDGATDDADAMAVATMMAAAVCGLLKETTMEDHSKPRCP
jgi:hypothetical protein